MVGRLARRVREVSERLDRAAQLTLDLVILTWVL
jgi:hypothetical protein